MLLCFAHHSLWHRRVRLATHTDTASAARLLHRNAYAHAGRYAHSTDAHSDADLTHSHDDVTNRNTHRDAVAADHNPSTPHRDFHSAPAHRDAFATRNTAALSATESADHTFRGFER